MLRKGLALSFGCSSPSVILIAFGFATLMFVRLIHFLFFLVASGEAVLADVPLVSPGEARDAQHGRSELSLHHHLCPRLERKKGELFMSVIPPYDVLQRKFVSSSGVYSPSL